jgi:multicomponent Na+:H+ antiporter subunit A
MTLVWTFLILLAALLVTGPLTRVLGRETGWLLAGVYLVAMAVFVPTAREVLAGGVVEVSVPWVPQYGVELAFRVDGLGVVFTTIALVIGAVVLAYSARYLSPGRHASFFPVMVFFTLSMMGLVLADDLVLLFICWELTSLASCLLIAQSGNAGEVASMRTLLLTFIGGLLLIPAVLLIVVRTGTMSVSEALAHPVWSTDPGFTALVAVLVAVAAMTKSAQFPFHVWLPDAMAASTPVSAYLHAAAVVKAGIFLLMRFSPAFHATPAWNATLITVGLFTAVLGARIALQQTDLKKLMAYSTVSQPYCTRSRTPCSSRGCS